MSNVTGIKDLQVAIAKHKKATVKGLRAGLGTVGLFIKREAQKITPVDEDVLRPSIDAIMEGSGFTSGVNVGTNTKYAIYVHENLEARHKPGTSAKFLEIPFREKRDVMAEILTEKMEEFYE